MRKERFSQYQWAFWPDEALVEAASHLFMPYVTRIEQRLSSEPELLIEIEGEYFESVPQVEAKYQAYGQGETGRKRALRLTWQNRWIERDGGLSKGGTRVHRLERIYFLETYEEFYAGPFGEFHPYHQGVKGEVLYEVVNDPDPWVMEILRENKNTDTFPPYPPKSLEYHRETDTFSGPGRFLPPDWQNEHNGSVYFWSGDAPPTPEEQAEFERLVERNKQAQTEYTRSQPLYRHLFISSESVMVEILCSGLPRWEWIEVPEES